MQANTSTWNEATVNELRVVRLCNRINTHAQNPVYKPTKWERETHAHTEEKPREQQTFIDRLNRRCVWWAVALPSLVDGNLALGLVSWICHFCGPFAINQHSSLPMDWRKLPSEYRSFSYLSCSSSINTIQAISLESDNFSHLNGLALLCATKSTAFQAAFPWETRSASFSSCFCQSQIIC